MRKSFWLGTLIVAWFLFAAGAARADNSNCSGQEIAHDYQREAADLLQPRQADLTRPFTGTGKLEVNICHADLHVRTHADAKELRIHIDMNGQPGGQSISDFIQVFRIHSSDGVVHLKFPADAHATVTITLPMNASSTNEFNLGKGNLDFDAIGSAGHREFNVGMGNMNLLVDGDKTYSTMEVNVGMGSLHDHRPGGHNGHFAVSRDFTGTGTGAVEINVGMGSLDIRQE